MELYGTLKKDTLEKLYAFCAYQERCKQDVIKKLNKLEITERYHEEYLNHLQEEKFLDESRFVRSFIRGKLRSNQWGKRKISFALKQKAVKESLIQEGLEAVEEQTYFEIAMAVAEKKLRSIKEKEAWKRKQKLYAYLAQKGFESYLISNVIDEILKK